MPARVPDSPIPFDPAVLERLACPVCFGVLRVSAPALAVECGACRRNYPLVDGIPVLIADRAVSA